MSAESACCAADPWSAYSAIGRYAEGPSGSSSVPGPGISLRFVSAFCAPWQDARWIPVRRIVMHCGWALRASRAGAVMPSWQPGRGGISACRSCRCWP